VLTVDTHRGTTSRTVRRVPVLPPAQLANLPRGRVVVFTRGMAMVIGRVRMAWQRRDVRAQTRATRAVPARTETAAAHLARPVAHQVGGRAPERVWASSTREDRS